MKNIFYKILDFIRKKLTYRTNVLSRYTSLLIILFIIYGNKSYSQASVFNDPTNGNVSYLLCNSTSTTSGLKLTCSKVIENRSTTTSYTGTQNQTITVFTNVIEFFNIKIVTPNAGTINLATLNPISNSTLTPNFTVAMKAGSVGYINFTDNATNSFTYGTTFNAGSVKAVDGLYSIYGLFTRQRVVTYFSSITDDPEQPADIFENTTSNHHSNQIAVTVGNAPTFSINTKTDENVVLLQGCEPTVKLKVNNVSNCATDAFALSIQQVDPLSITSSGIYPTIGPEIYRNLNSTELASIISSGGLSLTSNTFTDNTNSITIQAGNTYSVKLVYNGLGVFKPTYKILQYKSGSYDLIMKDYAGDNGFEPSVGLWSSQTVFGSPDIWNESSSTSSPNPDFVTIPTNSNKMMGKITNIGCASSPADEPLRMFWTLARTDEVWKNNWIYDLTNNGVIGKVSGVAEPLGSEITIGGTYSNPWSTNSQPYLLPAISAGATHTISNNTINWFPPNPAEYSPANVKFNGARPVICLLARINEKTSTNDPISWEPTGTTKSGLNAL